MEPFENMEQFFFIERDFSIQLLKGSIEDVSERTYMKLYELTYTHCI